MLLYRVGPEGFFAVEDGGKAHVLHSDPFEDPPETWRLGRPIDPRAAAWMSPVAPGKVVGLGKTYAKHAEELGGEVPPEPVIFLKSPGTVIGPRAPIVLPPESQRVDYEGEIAVVLRRTLRRASPAEVRRAVLGVTAACDVTARDLQRRDLTYARAKSFDTFCPMGPAIRIEPELEGLTVATRLNGEVRQRGAVREMHFPLVETLAFVSRAITLEPGDVVLTGTPAGVGPLSDGDRVEVEVAGIPPLVNPVTAWRQG